jgi:hypothetical protein
MGRKGKLKIDFDTISVLEVCIDNKWFRVTAITFRSFDGYRRINGIPYEGPIYMYQQNIVVPFTNTCRPIYNPDTPSLIGVNNNPAKRCLP